MSIDFENDDKLLLFGCADIQINKEKVKQFSCLVDFEDDIEERHHGYSKLFCDGEYVDGMLNYNSKEFLFHSNEIIILWLIYFIFGFIIYIKF